MSAETESAASVDNRRTAFMTEWYRERGYDWPVENILISQGRADDAMNKRWRQACDAWDLHILQNRPEIADIIGRMTRADKCACVKYCTRGWISQDVPPIERWEFRMKEIPPVMHPDIPNDPIKAFSTHTSCGALERLGLLWRGDVTTDESIRFGWGATELGLAVRVALKAEVESWEDAYVWFRSATTQ